MASLRGFTQWRALTMDKEATFDTAEPITNAFTENFIGGDPFSVLIDTEDDTVEINSAEEAGDLNELARRSEGSHEARMTPHTAGFFLSNALGYVSTTAVDEPATGFYTHNIHNVPKTKAHNDGELLNSTDIDVDDNSDFPASGTLLLVGGHTVAYGEKGSATQFTSVTASHPAIAGNEAIYLVRGTSGSVLKSFSVYEELGHTQQRRLTGVVVQDLNISCARKQFAMINATMLGSGSHSFISTETRPSLITLESPLKASGATVNIGGTWTGMSMGSGTSLNAVVNNFNWTYTNELEGDEGYLFNGASADVHARGRAEKIRSSQTMSFDLEFADSTYLDYLTNGTEFAFQIQFTSSSSYQVDLVFPKCRMLDSTVSGGTGTMIESHNVQVMEDSVFGSVDAIVINKQDGYLK